MFTGPDMVIGRMARLHDRVGEGRAPSSALEEGSRFDIGDLGTSEGPGVWGHHTVPPPYGCHLRLEEQGPRTPVRTS